MATRDFKPTIFTDPNMAFPLAKTLEGGNPQLMRTVVTSHQESHLVEYNNIKLKKDRTRRANSSLTCSPGKQLKATATEA
jgi:putative ABC transport system permease protein